jgi:hypothetical protein
MQASFSCFSKWVDAVEKLGFGGIGPFSAEPEMSTQRLSIAHSASNRAVSPGRSCPQR